VTRQDLPKVTIESRAQWRAWLAAHHASSGSIWLVTYKKGSGRPDPGYDAIVEEAICFGWIDSLPRKLDEARSMLRLSPRKPTSAWSKLDKTRATRLIKAGLMQPAGLRVIAAAKHSGAWDRLNGADTDTIPPDLRKAFAAHPCSAKNFATFPPSSRRAILEWLAQAKLPETRARRVKETATLAARNIRANHYRQPKTASQRRG
jgi:uncharacterized protein YdeI (YjbR/CyaY-like superfamily)